MTVQVYRRIIDILPDAGDHGGEFNDGYCGCYQYTWGQTKPRLSWPTGFKWSTLKKEMKKGDETIGG